LVREKSGELTGTRLSQQYRGREGAAGESFCLNISRGEELLSCGNFHSLVLRGMQLGMDLKALRFPLNLRII